MQLAHRSSILVSLACAVPSICFTSVAGAASAASPVTPSLLYGAPARSTVVACASNQDAAKDRRSLEELLREVMGERSRASVALYPEVARIMGEIDLLKASRSGPLSREKSEELARLGPGALPLMVPYLEPGKDVNRRTIFRSELVGRLLRDTPSAVTTDPLLAVASKGSVQGRLSALSALESTPEPRRVGPVVIEIAAGRLKQGLSRDGAASVQEAAFCTLARLADERSRAFIGESLRSSDESLCAGALTALADAPAETSSAQILALLKNLDNAKPVATALANYYEQHDDLLSDPEHARALGSIAVHVTTPNEPRVRMFTTLRVTDAKIGTPIKRLVSPFREASRPEVRNSALMLLARLKDRGAKQELLREHDNRIKREKNSISAHSDRATIYHSIGDWSASVRDWRVVMTQMADNELARSRKEPYIGIARSLARLKKFREAASYLSQGPISVDELQKLGENRDFVEMRESRYGDVFQFGD